jgi:hypothetical protein
MSLSRRLSLALGFLAVVALLVWWLAPSPDAGADLRPPPSSVATKTGNLRDGPPARAPQPAATDVPVSVAADLNSPRFDITHDLNLVDALFTDWRLNFPGAGHPFGENSEITSALTGNNPLNLPLIPRNHPAINAAGELCDRWGTPFRFHALAGDRMELRSAGPDKRFGTPDDVVLTPPGASGAPVL